MVHAVTLLERVATIVDQSVKSTGMVHNIKPQKNFIHCLYFPLWYGILSTVGTDVTILIVLTCIIFTLVEYSYT